MTFYRGGSVLIKMSACMNEYFAVNRDAELILYIEVIEKRK